MKIIALIDGKKTAVVKKILKDCELWKDPIPRSPPEKEKFQIEDTEKSVYINVIKNGEIWKSYTPGTPSFKEKTINLDKYALHLS